MTRLEHIGIAVAKAEPVAELLEDLFGFTVYKTETVEREGVRTYFLDAKRAKIELLETLGENTPVGQFLSKRGPGVHHLAFEVDDVEATIERGRALGLQPLSDEPLPGADGKRIAFFHPRDTFGVLIEVCQSIRRV